MTNTITLNAVGDMIFDENVGKVLAQKGGDYLFDCVRSTLSSNASGYVLTSNIDYMLALERGDVLIDKKIAKESLKEFFEMTKNFQMKLFSELHKCMKKQGILKKLKKYIKK